MILRGMFVPGQRLVEEQLANQLGISRVPVRESLNRLRSEGLVRREPNRATYVEDFHPIDALEIYLMRLTLEPVGTYLAATRGDPRLIRRLRRLSTYMIDATNERELAVLDRLDEWFHLSIMRACGSAQLLRAYENAPIRVFGPRIAQEQLMDPQRHLYADEHLELIALLWQRRAAKARRWARQHVQRSLRVVEEAVGMRMRDLPVYATVRSLS